MTRARVTFTDAELDILAHALVCFDIANGAVIGAERWWNDDDTLWILQKMCKMGDKAGPAPTPPAPSSSSARTRANPAQATRHGPASSGTGMR